MRWGIVEESLLQFFVYIIYDRIIKKCKTYRKGKRGKKKERMVSRGNVSYYAPRSKEKETL